MSVLPSTPPPASDSLHEQAARWSVRRDRGLSATESIEFELWLAADERHAAAMQRSSAAWAMLDRIPDRVAQRNRPPPARRRSFWRRAVPVSLAAAAALALGYVGVSRLAQHPAAAAPRLAQLADSPIRILADGSVVRLNTGAEIAERFTAAERRVLLLRGEAHFTVTKNPARPFIVRAGTVEVVAVGTAFNVNLQSAAVEVLVTEGRVAVARTENRGRETGAGAAAPSAGLRPLISGLSAGERAVVALAPASAETAVAVATVNPEEIARTLAWQEPLLRLNGATLAELAAEFQRRTGLRLVLGDPALAGLRVGGRFRSDDVDGFVRLLEDNYGVQSERRADGAIVLRKAR